MRARTAATAHVELLHEALGLEKAAYSRLASGLEASCTAVRRSELDETFRLAWFQASVAVLAGAKDTERLLDGQALRWGNLGCAAGVQFGHACHALDEFPDQKGFKLAAIVALPRVAMAARQPDDRGAVMLGFGLTERPADELLHRAVDLLTPLVADQSAGPEAQLRRGVLRFRLGLTDESRTDLASAFRSDDAAIRYLAGVFHGLVLDFAGRSGEATQAYRAATLAHPAGSVARLSLVGSLFAQGRHAEARNELDQTAETDPVTDPWRTFSLGSYRNWPRLRDQLRAAVRQ